MNEGSVDVGQLALTLLRPSGEERVTGPHVMVAGHGWDDPVDKAAYDQWQLTTLRLVCLSLTAQRSGQQLPAQLPQRPRGPECSGATALSAELRLLPARADVESDLNDLICEEVTLLNAPDPLVELAMSIADQSSDLDDPGAVAALQVWSAAVRPRGEWWSKFYGALARPRVAYEVDGHGRRRATLHWTAIQWAGYIELPYGECVTLDIDEASCSLSRVSDRPPPALSVPAAATA